MKFWKKKAAPPTAETLKATDLPYVFTDQQGRRYYGFPATMQFPLDRHARRADTINYMAAGLTGAEIRALTDVAITELENLATGKKGSIVKAAAAMHELRNRDSLAVHHELVYQFIAIHYIREDENPYEVVDHVMDEKIEAFKEMVAGGRLMDFFHLPELTNICNTIGLSSEEFQQRWNESIAAMRILNQKLQYLKSHPEIISEGKTSKKA